jgi:HlyD family secretion protein
MIKDAKSKLSKLSCPKSLAYFFCKNQPVLHSKNEEVALIEKKSLVFVLNHKIFLKLMSYWVWILAIFLVLGISGITYVFFINNHSKKLNSSHNKVTESQAVLAVAGAGRLEPQGKIINLSAATTLEVDKRLSQLLVKEGDPVHTGQVIAILDIFDSRLASLKKSQQQLNVANARLKQVKAGVKSGELLAQKAEIARLKAQLRGELVAQEAEISRLKSQLQGELESQQAIVTSLESELANAQLECNRYQQLYKEGTVSTSNRDGICLIETKVKAQLQQAKSGKIQTEKTIHEQLNESYANLNRLQATFHQQINQAQATLNQLAEIRPVDIEVAKAEVESAFATVKQAQSDLGLAYVRSPIDAYVLKIHTRPGEVVKQDGIVSLGRTEQMNVLAEIYESDIDKVKVGQKAIITSDAFNDQLQGTVTEIGWQVGEQKIIQSDPTADVNARVVEVTLSLNKKDSERLSKFSNLQVKVIINLF